VQSALVDRAGYQEDVFVKDDTNPLALLRKPFPDNQISKLPKPTKAQTDAVKQDFKKGVRCKICGAWHHPDVVHLDYVGHAALTDRLLDTDPAWTWEPVGFNPNGLPAMDQAGGMWIKLTVHGVTRFGYGAADGKSGGDAVKEIIGDALRNAAMRFGAALDLWHKGDLHVEPEPEPEKTVVPKKPEPLSGNPYRTRAEANAGYGEIVRQLHACGDSDQLEAYLATDAKDALEQFRNELPKAWNGDGFDFIGMNAEIENARKRVADVGPY